MQFGDVLRELLDEKGISQKQMAQDLNIVASTLGNYIRNLRQPDFETVCRIAEYFGVTTDYMFDYHANKKESRLEMELLRVFRDMTQEQQIIYLEQGKAVAKMNRQEKTKSSKQIS